MITLQTALAFFTASLLLSATPGPDNLFVLMQSATAGRRAGLSVVLGLCTGLLVHTSAVALGLAALFAASALAFTLLKIAGSAYLLYLAWGAWHAPAQDLDAVDRPADGTARRGWSSWLAAPMYRRGVVMNLTNPKVVFFFLAFLPQFVQPGAPGTGPVALQIVCLGALFILATLLAFGAVVFFAAALRERLLRSARAQRWLNRAAALVFAGLAARLALAQR
ncbi:LysE family translocator [Comamonadaceae bacterium PP-2]